MPTTVEEFEHIIRHQSITELLPFLLALPKRDVVPVRAKLKALRKELESIVQLSENSWGSRSTREQYEALFLTGFAVYSRTDALRSLTNGWALAGNNYQTIKGLHEAWLALISAIRPDWLGDWLRHIHRNGRDWAVGYALLRTLEEEQLIPYVPEIVVKAVVQALSDWGGELSQGVSVPLDAAAAIADRFRADPLLLRRDLPLLFEFDTAVNAYSARIQLVMPFDAEGAQDANGRQLRPWQVWEQKHPIQVVSWQNVIVQLAATNHLDRADLLTRCLLALRRDFRRPLLTWFKDLFLKLEPTTEELLARQNELLELPHAMPLVANFALTQLTQLLQAPAFSPTVLLPLADSFMARPELKTSLRALIMGLLKCLKQEPAQAPTIARLLAAALPHPDGAVQERAAKGLAGLLNAAQPLLDPTETAVVVTAIQQATDLLGGPARTVLVPWLEPAVVVGGPGAAAAYAPTASFVPDISAATAIAPVADWHELLFLTGQVVQHRDPAVAERWLDGLLRLPAQLPADFAAQLKPYLVQRLPALKKASVAESTTLLAGPVNTNGHEGLAQALLLSWATGFATARVARVNLKGDYAAPGPLLSVEKQRYLCAETLLRQGHPLPLLSTPTHEPYWVAPNTLVARLLAYQAAGIPPAPADLAVALARTAHSHAASSAEALTQLPALVDIGLRELLTWFFGPADAQLPTLPSAAPQRPGAKLSVELAGALPELWAVAARTKAPLGRFPTLPAALGYDYPGVAQPLLSTCVAVPHENRHSGIGEPTRVYRYVELAWDSGTTRPAPSPLLLYAPPVGRSQRGSWEENIVMAEDLPFFGSLLPHNPAPVHEHALRNGAWTDKLETAERDIVQQALRSLLPAGPVYLGASLDLLACGLVHNLAECRRLAQEVLLRAIAAGRLLPASLGEILGRQLAAEYAPVPRLSDGLTALTGIDPLTDDALTQVLEALLPELPAAPPRSTRKLLETYALVQPRTARMVPAAVRARLGEWRAVASLKPLVKQVLT
ncbi:DUF6493 family protein [Hymenobacter aerophilus]|uniref:DUF6493 family protein n=1 Tax=Hymenobacter aerophilus TaxID=119644 RepID=UPI00039A1F50|nr:DUF6493 family protein [Hymenobacter aerophilus]